MIESNGRVLKAGNFVSFKPGSRHTSRTETECLLIVFEWASPKVGQISDQNASSSKPAAAGLSALEAEGWNGAVVALTAAFGWQGQYFSDLYEAFSRWTDRPNELPLAAKFLLLVTEHIRQNERGRYYSKAKT